MGRPHRWCVRRNHHACWSGWGDMAGRIPIQSLRSPMGAASRNSADVRVSLFRNAAVPLDRSWGVRISCGSIYSAVECHNKCVGRL